MKKLALRLSALLLLAFVARVAYAQPNSPAVSIEPTDASQSDAVTVIFDASLGNGECAGLPEGETVYLYGSVGINPGGMSWHDPFTVGTWGDLNSVLPLTRDEPTGDIYRVTLTPDDYFSIPEGTVAYNIACLFVNGTENGGFANVGRTASAGDFFLPLTPDLDFTLDLASTTFSAHLDEPYTIEGTTSELADIEITLDGQSVATFDDVESFSFTPASDVAGVFNYEVSAQAVNNDFSASFPVAYYVIDPVQETLQTDPLFPQTDTENVTITYDARGGNAALAGFDGDVFVYTWLTTDRSTGLNGASYELNPWPSITDGTAPTPVLMTRVEGETDVYEYTFSGSLREVYGVPEGEEILYLNFVFRDQTGDIVGRNFGGADIRQRLYDPSRLYVKLTAPTGLGELLEEAPESLTVSAATSILADISVRQIKNNQNGMTVAETFDNTDVSVTLTTNTDEKNTFVVTAEDDGGNTATTSFYYYVRPELTVAAQPAGTRDGLNIDENGDVTLVLHAPDKDYGFVLGSFNDWEFGPDGYMNQTPDGQRYWVTYSELDADTEHVFQYAVTGDDPDNGGQYTAYVGDPYSDKVLTPNDRFIEEQTFPGLIEYPAEARGLATAFTINEPEFEWSQESLDFQRPSKRSLVIYEALLRDFSEAHSYRSMTDRLDELADLGVNCIELMPVMEYSGNNSWGYNPTYFLAPDKYYGPKEDLKELIDECHKRGIAVVLDIVPNHADDNCALTRLYWDNVANLPASNNPYFNRTAPHQALTFFRDFNHESAPTQDFWDRVIEHWLVEYRVDGFRYDFTKGLTQRQTSNFDELNQFDESRLDILRRIQAHQESVSPGSYMMCEHLLGSEEEVMANEGMMAWKKAFSAYKELSLGFDGDISWLNYNGATRQDAFISYAVSHDEERIMYENLNFGNSSGSYSARDFETALERQKALVATLLLVPGPKLYWQFDEIGYEYSINRCEDGSISNNCRTFPKPVPESIPDTEANWSAADLEERERLSAVYGAVAQLRQDYPNTFLSDDFSISGGNNRVKLLYLTAQPFTADPQSTDEMSALVVANFDVVEQSVTPFFQHTGTWYEYFDQAEKNVANTEDPLTLQPGEFRIYTNVELPAPEAGITDFNAPATPSPTATALTDTEIRIAWSADADADGFTVFRSATAEGTFTEIASLTGTATQYEDPNLTAETEYFYQVVATNDVGGKRSATVSATTLPEPLDDPDLPDNLTATAVSTTEIQLSWTVVGTTLAPTQIIVERSTTSGSGFAEIATVAAADAGQTQTYDDSGLTAETEYFYRVAAIFGSVQSAYSAEFSATTDPEPVTGLEDDLGEDLRLFPNPASDALNLHIDRALTGSVKVVLRDATGKQARVYTFAQNGQSLEVSLPTGTLKSGLYMLEVRSESGSALRKFFKR